TPGIAGPDQAAVTGRPAAMPDDVDRVLTALHPGIGVAGFRARIADAKGLGLPGDGAGGRVLGCSPVHHPEPFSLPSPVEPHRVDLSGPVSSDLGRVVAARRPIVAAEPDRSLPEGKHIDVRRLLCALRAAAPRPLPGRPRHARPPEWQGLRLVVGDLQTTGR